MIEIEKDSLTSDDKTIDGKLINIRRATIEDLDSIIAVEAESFPVPWPRQAFVDELTRNIVSYYVVIEQDRDVADDAASVEATPGQADRHKREVVGYMGMWIIVDEAHITNIAVHPKARRQQLAELAVRQMMLVARERGAERMTLEVRESNEPAIALYEKLGFKNYGIRKDYYIEPREDAIIMWVNL